MKLLLDENVDYDFKFLLPEHDARHVDDFEWKGLTNGKLLDAAEARDIDVIVTADKNFQFQQNIASRRLALVVLDVHPKNLANLTACAPELRSELPKMVPGNVYVIQQPEN
jgi:hypothetical protein